MSGEIEERSSLAAHFKQKVEWRKYPHLARIFRFRAVDNVYWHELIELMQFWEKYWEGL